MGVEIGQGLTDVDIKNYIKVEKVPGGQLEDSRVLKGVMIKKDVVAPSKMSKRLLTHTSFFLILPLSIKRVKTKQMSNCSKKKTGFSY